MRVFLHLDKHHAFYLEKEEASIKTWYHWHVIRQFKTVLLKLPLKFIFPKLFTIKMTSQKKVAILGSGNWGSAIARIIGENVLKYKEEFDGVVKMYVYEEMVDGRKLTEIINAEHENVKYLKGYKLPSNVVAVPDVVETAQDADILIFVIPHAFVPGICKPLVGKLKSGAIGISLIKGFGEGPDGKFILISNQIQDLLKIECAVLMGANLAIEVARNCFCETTIGCKSKSSGETLRLLFDTPNFRVNVVPDRTTVEICGALKNIVACASGFADGLKWGDNTKSAIIRNGLMEILRFCRKYYTSETKVATFFESCGIADLITTCFGGRNRRVSEQFILNPNKSLQQLEEELLQGQKLQGPQTAQEVYKLFEENRDVESFPLFVAVHKILQREIGPEGLIEAMRREPLDELNC